MLPDFGYDDYKSMLRVDSSAIEAPIVLKPLEEWNGRQELSFVSSSYCSGQLDPLKVLHGWMMMIIFDDYSSEVSSELF